MARTGRPTKLNREIHERIVLLLEKGNYFETAAAAAGIHRNVLREWIKKGSRAMDDDVPSEYRAFAEDVLKAMAEAEIDNVNVIRDAAIDSRNWTARAWLLERRHPERWAKQDPQVVVNNNHQLPGYVEEKKQLSTEDAYARLRRRGFKALTGGSDGEKEGAKREGERSEAGGEDRDPGDGCAA